MRRFAVGFPVVLLGVLAATAADVMAADTAPAAAAAGPKAASPSPTSSTPAAVAASASLRRVVCLSVSLQCFRVATSAPAANAAATPAKSLDLRAPDIRALVSQAELQQPVDEEWVIREREQEQQVRVEGARPDIYVPGGIASLPWAVMNPTQAWRIFLPVPSAK